MSDYVPDATFERDPKWENMCPPVQELIRSGQNRLLAFRYGAESPVDNKRPPSDPIFVNPH